VQLFSRQLYTLLKAGVPIMRGLAGLQESAMNKAFAKVLQDVRESLDSGRELSVSMSRQPQVFSPFYISMVRVGEMTGMLDQIFLRLFDHLEFERETRERVKAALRYPMFVVVAMIAAIVIINLFVIPAFAKVYAGFNAELPVMTQLLIAGSNFTVRFWPWLLLLAISSVAGFRVYIRTIGGKYQWDKFKLRLPVAGKIMLKGTLARFARSFALASKSGVPIVQGLSVVAQVVDNDYIAERIDQMRESIERGESVLRAAVATGVFTPVVLQMIAVGEETGELDDLMQEIAEMYDREVDYEVKTLSAQIEPILIVGLGILVLILALGVFLPIWDLGKAALHK
jgi:MSHA biogenesis protein MshG